MQKQISQMSKSIEQMCKHISNGGSKGKGKGKGKSASQSPWYSQQKQGGKGYGKSSWIWNQGWTKDKSLTKPFGLGTKDRPKTCVVCNCPGGDSYWVSNWYLVKNPEFECKRCLHPYAQILHEKQNRKQWPDVRREAKANSLDCPIDLY